MTRKFPNLRALALGIAGALLLASSVGAAEVRVMISGGLTAAYKVLVPEFERSTGRQRRDRQERDRADPGGRDQLAGRKSSR